MRIAVCIKQVPVSEKVTMDPVTHNLIRENTEMGMNPADMNALTEAILWKKEHGGTIDVFTMGVPAARSVLYTALAMGADEAYLVTDRAFAGGDSLGTARVLAAALQATASYDMVICGSISADGATGQVGPMMAQLMNIPSASGIKKISGADDGYVQAEKSWKGKFVQMRFSTPVLVTVSLGSNMPILPTLRNQMKAKKKEIHELTNADLGLNMEEIGQAGAKSLVTDTVMAEKSGKQSRILTGSADEIAGQVLRLIKEARM